MRPNPEFWRGKRVLLTGHTGFKGAWTLCWLNKLGAHVTGLSLAPETAPAMFDQIGGDELCQSTIFDLRDKDKVSQIVGESDPEIVIHMAAQTIVGQSIDAPLDTLSSNVMGTAHLLDALRGHDGIEAILIITSDKVYANDDRGRAFEESDELGGKDPYSASKAAKELIVRSFAQTYFSKRTVPIATARCGNIVGGGDYSDRRILPDVVRAAERGEALVLRHPEATRPWLHVIDGICGYLVYAEALAQNKPVPNALNFGPSEETALSVRDVTEIMQTALGASSKWRHEPVPGSVEMITLAVNSALARETLGWSDRIRGKERIELTADWYRKVADGADPRRLTFEQIDRVAAADR
ncbi:MAG: CDP-glucose 4,6-dehydratase [Pseudomonadota bacterium]